MTTKNFKNIFTQDVLKKLFPEDRADRFFDALFGDAAEGAYDISLEFKKYSRNKLRFEFHLKQRRGKCLSCNLTFGLPEVFSRHPVININKIVQEIDQLLKMQAGCTGWQLGSTHEISGKLHVIPLIILLDSK